MLGVIIVIIGVMSNRLQCARATVPTTKLNYLVLGLSLGIAIVDCLKMPFAADRKYNDSPFPVAG